MERITVKPLGSAWTVQAPHVTNDLVFWSGREAEGAAKTLARRLAQAGQTIEVELRLRSGRRGARYVCVPPVENCDDVLMLSLPGLAIAANDSDLQGASA